MAERTTYTTSAADEQRSPGMSEKDKAAFALSCSGNEPYILGPDSRPQATVPPGTVTQHRWTSGRIYPGVERDYWLYIPKQYDPSRPACLMVFQDALLYL